MKILVTGAAGFIGFHVTKKLLDLKYQVIGIDNFNNYYDAKLKNARQKYLKKHYKKNLVILKKDLKNLLSLKLLFKKYKFSYVINLAAQAGVRYSISKPDNYFDSNIVGFYNLLKCCKEYKVKHLIVGSSSSVYGNQKNNTNEKFNTNKPLSFYAATKKTNEIMAYSFSNVYKLPITILRFFTVYGPWGRPDMALYKFTKAISKNKKFNLFNNGDHYRDFTYIDDIVQGVILSIKKIPNKKRLSDVPYNIYNLGNNKTIFLKNFVKEIEFQLKKKAKYKNLKLQNGDVLKTSANILKAKKILGYNPKTNIKTGISNFLSWYKEYHTKN